VYRICFFQKRLKIKLAFASRATQNEPLDKEGITVCYLRFATSSTLVVPLIVADNDERWTTTVAAATTARISFESFVSERF
jgi:hypothetical protein